MLYQGKEGGKPAVNRLSTQYLTMNQLYLKLEYKIERNTFLFLYPPNGNKEPYCMISVGDKHGIKHHPDKEPTVPVLGEVGSV